MYLVMFVVVFFLRASEHMKVFVFLIASAVGKCVVFLFTRHKVELVGGIGPTVGKVLYVDRMQII